MCQIDMVGTGNNIAKMCKKAGMKPKDIQEACGISSVQAVYKWFHGQSIPNIDNIVTIAMIFNVKIDDIIVVKD